MRDSQKKKVLTAGHICLDLAPSFYDNGTRHIEELLQPGKTLEVGAADLHTGGSVANTGLAMKIFGNDVKLLAKVGNDAFGEIVRGILKKYQADEYVISSENDSTAYTAVLAPPGIDRIFLHHQGANATFSSGDVRDDLLKEADLFHFGYPTAMAAMYANDGKELIDLMQRAHEAGAMTSLDLCGIDPNSASGRSDWRGILEATLPYVDFFLPSIEELCYILDRRRFASWKEKAQGGDVTEVISAKEEAALLADQCLSMGTAVAVIKCGLPGIYCKTAGKERMAKIFDKKQSESWSNREIFESSYLAEKFLSGTGAGDASIAAFHTALLEGEDLEMALHMAAAAGAACVTAYDAISGLPSYDELKKKVADGWKKIDSCVG